MKEKKRKKNFRTKWESWFAFQSPAFVDDMSQISQCSTFFQGLWRCVSTLHSSANMQNWVIPSVMSTYTMNKKDVIENTTMGKSFKISTNETKKEKDRNCCFSTVLNLTHSNSSNNEATEKFAEYKILSDIKSTV